MTSQAVIFFLFGALVGAAVAVILWLRDRQGLVEDRARLTAERDVTARSLDAQQVALADNQVQLRDAFAALSHAALKENRDGFFHDAASLLTPMEQALDRVQRHLVDVDRAREGSFRAVEARLGSLTLAQEQLRGAAETLSRSLSSPNARGAWGEVQLRRVVELAGMLAHCDFEEKVSVASDAGARLTPDMVIRLPGGGTIVLDAKVPMQAFRSALNATDDAARDQALAAHARQLRDHIRSLGAKEYWRQFQPAPDLVVMFLPLESLLPSAFERDESLFDLAASLRVIPATPMSLLALLKTISAGWKQQQLAENAEEIRLIGRELYERLVTMVDHLEGVGRNIRQAADSYNNVVGSLEQKVLSGARRFTDLGVTSTKTLAAQDPLRIEVRAIVKPELTGSRETTR